MHPHGHTMIIRDVNLIAFAAFSIDGNVQRHAIVAGLPRKHSCRSDWCESAACGIDIDGDTAMVIEHDDHRTSGYMVKHKIHVFGVPGLALAAVADRALDTSVHSRPYVLIQTWGTTIDPDSGGYPTMLFPGLATEDVSIDLEPHGSIGQGVFTTAITRPVELPWSNGTVEWQKGNAIIMGRVSELPSPTMTAGEGTGIHPALDG